MEVFKKKCYVTYKNRCIQIKEINNTGTCYVGKCFYGAEFDSEEELNNFILENDLVTLEEIESMYNVYYMDELVDVEKIREHIFSDDISLEPIDDAE